MQLKRHTNPATLVAVHGRQCREIVIGPQLRTDNKQLIAVVLAGAVGVFMS